MIPGDRGTLEHTHDESIQEHERSRQEHKLFMQESDRVLRELKAEGERSRQEHQRKMDRLDARIKHEVRLFVREARAERTKRRELDEKLTQLAASHILAEEALRDLKATVDSFIQSMRRGGNGHTQT